MYNNSLNKDKKNFNIINMKISIAMCTYNGEKYIQRLIDTIWQQTYQTFEVIFINDGSKDQTAKVIIEKLEEKQYQNYVLAKT